MKIGRRDIFIFLKRIFSIENYKAFMRFKDVHTQPIKSVYQEIFSSGKIGGLIWSSPNNPTWVCFKEEELKSIGDLLLKLPFHYFLYDYL